MKEILLESWERQAQIVANMATLINETNRKAKPSPDGMPLDEQLAHIHEVRYGWLNTVSKKHAEQLGNVYSQHGTMWHPIEDLDEIKRQVAMSSKVIGEAMNELLEQAPNPDSPYTHPIHFLQHMIWHEGWHVGLISLALRLNGEEPPEEWEEEHVWGLWRTEG